MFIIARFITVLAVTVLLRTPVDVRADLECLQVAPGVYRGRAPRTEDDYRQLQRLSVRTVLDVRTFRKRRMDKECRCIKAHGMRYVRSGVSFWPEKDGSAERAFCKLTDARLHPIYIHCELGRDRSGLIVALYRVRCQGWNPEAAYCEMERFGFHHYLRALERYFWDHAR
jgi:hypothetical protein